MATPTALSMSVATGSIRKLWGCTGRSLTTVRSRILTPTAVIAPSITGSVAGTISFFFSRTISPMPVPYTAALIRHSPTAFRTLFLVNSSDNASRKKRASAGFWSRISSAMSKNLPRPNVASSMSATVFSTAWSRAGETILLRSDSRVLSSSDQIPRHRR